MGTDMVGARARDFLKSEHETQHLAGNIINFVGMKRTGNSLHRWQGYA